MFPRPPPPKSTQDFVVQVLVFIVGMLFLSLPVMALIIELVRPSIDTGPIFQIELEMMKMLTAALVGYMAGSKSAE